MKLNLVLFLPTAIAATAAIALSLLVFPPSASSFSIAQPRLRRRAPPPRAEGEDLCYSGTCANDKTQEVTAQERVAALLGQSLVDEDEVLRGREAMELETQQRKRRNLGVALGSFVSSCSLFFIQHWAIVPSASADPLTLLRQMEVDSPNLAVALTSGKPIVLDFYAEWCENCRDMAPTMSKLEQEYEGKVNFVTVDGASARNSDLVSKFRVDGIPHLALIRPSGYVETALIGNVPKAVMEADIDALLQGQDLPYVGYDAFANDDHKVAFD
jgi:thiol-disulfide isomerase/thioredoxin